MDWKKPASLQFCGDKKTYKFCASNGFSPDRSFGRDENWRNQRLDRSQHHQFETDCNILNQVSEQIYWHIIIKAHDMME